MKSLSSVLVFCSLFVLSMRGQAQHYANTSIPNPKTKRNIWIQMKPDERLPPSFASSKSKLPEPIWPARQDVIRCYWKAWELAFSNLHSTTSTNHFVSPYIDPAFNGHIFMWDTSFMVLFGRYACQAFNFQGSLNNFYSRQHEDGFICREISTINGDELFQRFDPSSTGPNIMPWAEWEYFKNFNDRDRLRKVFDPLLAYYQWFMTNRSWPDGSYYSSGWGCGMDNQPRVPKEYDQEFSTAFMSWIDTSLQQVFAAKILVEMAKELGRNDEVNDLKKEIIYLTDYIQEKMWDHKSSFFYDRFRNGQLSSVKSIAAYWALLAGIVPSAYLGPFIDHLKNPKEFARLHRIPTLAADHPDFSADGHYWRGGVWAPTSYMVLRGLTSYSQDSLAYEIAYNHLDNVVKVFNQTGTLWENYAPDSVKGMYRKDMVGWTGLVPVSVLFEYVFGIRSDVPHHTITWDVRMLDEFGLKRYPFMEKGQIDFWCAKRRRNTEKPKIKIKSNVAFDLKLIWGGGNEVIHIFPG